MPAMQMEFWVKDRSLFDNAKAGDRVDFTIVETETGEYLTELKRAIRSRLRNGLLVVTWSTFLPELDTCAPVAN